ncbi:transcriptional regulator [Mesorhizobium sp. NBSH29]|uniref:transcriptional regulator n=1 Tax=Mesorhizobium sp. NBSH29 TaxID=2654249 RepID=UPI00189687BA|nr:transcriptional regulator [Mesorhizobium sp. NBSH29]QPC86336.1 transcriptional regulator [Mesorhizobium sp. NBSH29]
MAIAKTIIVVAPEGAFRRSLEFALEVEGFSVESHAQLSEAERSPTIAIALCAVVDESVLGSGAGPARSLDMIPRPVILLANEISTAVARKGLMVLTKPLCGSDLADALQGLSAL